MSWETPTEVVLHSPLWMVSIKHKLTLHAEVVKEHTIRGIINVSQILSPLCNMLLGKCPLISNGEVSSFCCTKLTRYFPILFYTSLTTDKDRILDYYKVLHF